MDWIKKYRTNKDSIPREEIAIGSEIERITTQLIEEYVGENGELEKELEKRLRELDGRPLGEEDVKRILKELLKKAAKNRNNLGNRLEQSITQGNMYEQYYKRLEEIDCLAVLANRRLQEMEYAQEQYEIIREQYEQVLGYSYIDIQAETKDETKRHKWKLKIKEQYKKIARAGKERKVDYDTEESDEGI